jgi:CheY-like chemotaxis protein
MTDPESLLPRSEAASESAAREPGKFKILVVDDNVDSAMSMAMLLRISGHDTRTAHDGEIALERVEAFRPELVLLDIGLPKLDGYEVARRIRAEAWGQSIFLVAVTGWGQDEDRRNTAAAGFDLHLVKPVDLESLEKLLAGLPQAKS